LRLVAAGGPATMLFDEVDAGVGGAAAVALGAALREVAGGRQVLVVTHLAQVAAFADQQVAVRKGAHGGRTVTTATVLDRGERVVELSRMLSGHPDSEVARAHAEELLSTTAAVRTE
jgi:DNA repair protein RecN (Recombination protein N)